MPFFSVIIPTYNRLTLLKETVQSVLNQSLTDFEMLIVDDGSTDGTSNWASLIADTRVRYSYKENEGVCSARNFGASVATGSYLIFLDSDDLVVEHWLSDFNSEIIKSGADVVMCRRVINGTSTTTGYQGFLAGTFCIKTALFLKAGGYDTQLKFGENTELKWRVAQLTQHMVMIPKPNVIYRISQTGGGANRTNRVDFLYHVAVKHAALFNREPKTAQLLYQVAGVDCFYLKRYVESRKLLWTGFLKRPYNVKSFLRFSWYTLRTLVSKGKFKLV
jgi:glycosyltransferase involved in cell wall biosynthesis